MQILDVIRPSEKIQIMDVGASAINEQPVYKVLLDNDLAHLNAFEGDDRQIEGIRQAFGDKATVFREFLYDGRDATVYFTTPASGMTSLLQPNPKTLKFFNGFEIFGRVERTATIPTRRMDDIEGLPNVEFIKMDIQGAELTVLQNGRERLRDCLAIQLEVSFVNLYHGQPSFGEVDVWMRSQGMIPHRFLGIKPWVIAPTVFNNNFRIPGNQLMEADVVYMKDPRELKSFTDTQIRKAILLAHFCFGSIDLVVHFILELERRGNVPAETHRHYMQSLLAK
ncbi:FkbM family methyltransferase [Aestuariivirga sp.]|uniref:FkbM family methyltransferase n=1 Tax=Aestuariivirga sp. TaxID=2650926 RepID=UPI0039E431D4